MNISVISYYIHDVFFTNWSHTLLNFYTVIDSASFIFQFQSIEHKNKIIIKYVMLLSVQEVQTDSQKAVLNSQASDVTLQYIETFTIIQSSAQTSRTVSIFLFSQVLLSLMMVKSPITDADRLRGLACRALAGLARCPTVRQIISKLPLFTTSHLQGNDSRCIPHIAGQGSGVKIY